MRRLPLLVLGLSLSVLPLSAVAQPPEGERQREALRNGEGSRARDGEREGTRREGDSRLGESLGPREGAPFGPGRMLMRLPIVAALDVDGNGEISADEIDLAVVSLRKLDTNKDGKLSTDEMLPAMGEGGPGRGFPGQGFGGRGFEGRGFEGSGMPFGPGGRGPGGRFDGANSDEMLKRLFESDADNDGLLSSDELPERMRPMLDRADRDNDKKLSREEITALMSRIGGLGPRSEGSSTGDRQRPAEGPRGRSE